ncbi:MAG: c-type cytochrome [Bdellovibrionota bacterium]
MANNHNDNHSGNHNSGHDAAGHHGHHLVPLSVYVKTIIALLLLTIATVGASYVDIGKLNIFLSMGIALAKATLVLMFFMGLKYDTNLNRAYIISSFVAFTILMTITSTDLWTREKYTPVTVKSAVAPLTIPELNKLMVSTPELVARGKEVFNVNCYTCHGTEGKGDGAGGASLNPKPRNFHGPVSDWKNGTSFKAMYVTLMYGVPGSGMASYKALPPQDRIALIHYVHTWTPEVQNVAKGDEKFAAALKEDEIGEGDGSAPKVALPVDFAIDRVIQN